MEVTYRRAKPALRTWWDQPFEYGFAVQLLYDRGLLRFHRYTMFALTIANFIPAAIGAYWFIFSPGVGRPYGTWIAVASSVTAMGVAIYWLFGPWLSENVSLAMIAIADVMTVTYICFYTNWYLAMPGFALLAANGIYLLVHHHPRSVLIHLAFSVVSLTTFAVGCWWVQGEALALVVVRYSTLIPIVAGTPIALLPLIMIMRSAAIESFHDDLTGLDNRRGLTTKVSSLVARSTPLTVLVVDIDRFKNVNDSFGHAVGDEVLISVADAMRACVPTNGTIARTGGEEFAMLIAGYDVDGEGLARELHERVEHATNGVPSVTVSVGVTTSPATHRHLDIAALLDHADQAMYQAKRSGGNRTVLF